MRRYGIWLTAATVSLLGNAATFALMALVLLGLRRGLPGLAPVPAAAPGAFSRRVVDGVRVAAADRVLRPALGLTAAAGGAVAGALAMGTAVVAVTVLVRGAARRPGAAAVTGLMIAAGAVAALAAAPGVPAALAAGLVAGLGNGLFSAHIAPLVLGAAPGTHLARIQAVLVLVQSVPLLVTNNVLGRLADAGSASVVLATCAVALGVATTVAALRSGLPAAGAAADPRPVAGVS